MHHFADASHEREGRIPRKFRDRKVQSEASQQRSHRLQVGIDGSDIGYACEQDYRKRTERKARDKQNRVLDRLYDRFKVHHERKKKIRHFRGKLRRCYQTIRRF